MKYLRVIFLMIMAFTTIKKTIADENVKFSGTLVALPCTIPESDQQILVHFGKINAHDLYLGQAKPIVPFILHLNDCDPSIAEKVSVTFTGTEDPELPGLLALDSNKSNATGIAIGLESAAGDKILLNKSTSAYVLDKGNNELSFMAYIAGEPVAVKHRSMQTGEFNAMTVLELNYE